MRSRCKEFAHSTDTVGFGVSTIGFFVIFSLVVLCLHVFPMQRRERPEDQEIECNAKQGHEDLPLIPPIRRQKDRHRSNAPVAALCAAGMLIGACLYWVSYPVWPDRMYLRGRGQNLYCAVTNAMYAVGILLWVAHVFVPYLDHSFRLRLFACGVTPVQGANDAWLRAWLLVPAVLVCVYQCLVVFYTVIYTSSVYPYADEAQQRVLQGNDLLFFFYQMISGALTLSNQASTHSHTVWCLVALETGAYTFSTQLLQRSYPVHAFIHSVVWTIGFINVETNAGARLVTQHTIELTPADDLQRHG